METTYIKAATKKDQFPDFPEPEFAFVGRSNSGKSSLLNCLTNHQKAARTSSTPGRTQMVHFFRWQKNIILADLPGYGFSAASKSTEKSWNRLISDYFTRRNIKGILYLTDIRRGFDQYEIEFMKSFPTQFNLYLVLTKIDKCNQKELHKAKLKIVDQLEKSDLEPSSIFLISNLKKKGINELRRELTAFAE